MAGQKNINIVYNVDTSSVKIAADSVTQAKLATDQLNQSVQKFNDQAGTGFKATGVVVGDLKGELAALQAKIEQTDIADKARLATLQAQYREIKSQVEDYNKALQTTQENTKAIGTSLTSLGNTVRAVITAGILREMVSVNLEMAKLAGQVEGVKRAFDRLPNSILLMDELRAATHGTMTDLDLMTNAVKASNFHIPLQEMGKLLEFVAIKAQQTGLDIDYLTNSLVNGLARNSPRLLEHLGFSIAEIRENTRKYGEVSTAVYHLIDENLKTVGGFVDTSKTKVDNLTAAWGNLKVAASQTLNSTGFIGLLDKIVLGYTAMIKGQKQVDDEFNQGVAIKYAKEFLTDQNLNTEAIDKQIEKLKQEMQVRGALKATIKEQMALPSQQANQADRFAERDFQRQQLKTLADQNDIAQKEIQILKQKQSQLKSNNPDEKEQLGLIEALDKKIKDLNEDLLKTTSRKNIIEIQVQIKQAEAEKADLLDPDRMAKQAKGAFDKTNDEIRTGIRSNSETIVKESSKGAKSIAEIPLFKELNKNMMKDIHMFVDGLKDGMKEADQLQADHDKYVQHLMRFTGQQFATNARQIANILIQNDIQQYDDRIQALQDYYSNQEQLAGTNTKRVQQLQKEETQKQKQLEEERTKAQKRANIRRIEIDTAANVIKSILENGGVPWGLPFGGIAAAMGLLQIAAVNKFAEGVINLKGSGHDTSDNIPSLLSPGESVMTAKETRESGNILRSIRAKKLNDQILDKLTITTEGITASFDDSRIVDELKKGRQHDFIKRFGVIYEAKEESKNMRKIIRSKSFNG